jgi:hypothetical protein
VFVCIVGIISWTDLFVSLFSCLFRISSSMSAPPSPPEGGSVVGSARDHGSRTPSPTLVGRAREQGPGVGTPSSQESSSPSSSSGSEDSPAAPVLPAIVNTAGLQNVLYQKTQQDRPANTKKAVNPKIQEWERYCDHVFPDLGNEKYIPTKDNTYMFMLYQCLRSKRTQGGKQGGGKKKGKRSRKSREEQVEEEDAVEPKIDRGFKADEYDVIMAAHTAGGGEALLANPPDPIGYKMFLHYKLALQHLYSHYIQLRAVEENVFEPTIWGRDHVTLGNVVKNRKHEIATALYTEKMGGDATPYTQVDLIPKIEESFWRRGRRLDRSQLAALRNRHAFLMTTCGILRFESLAKRNLLEIFCFKFKGNRDPHECLITMFQLPDGKYPFVFD